MAGQQDTLMAPGTVFAGHVVEGLVGRGGMGVVYRARHCGLDRLDALKTIVPELHADASMHRLFKAEAATAAAVDHPNIVPLHDAGEADGIAYIVMRYVHGRDLHALVSDAGPLEPAAAGAVVAQVAAALDTLHAAGYVHRDVKPRNVLIARSGHVYLCDFGLATRDSEAELPVGTVDYVAPEQICGWPADPRSDVYALGGLLHFALTGRRPYERDSDVAKLWAHVYAPPPRPSRVRPGLSRALDAVVGRALAKDPDDRFASAGEFARAVAPAAAPIACAA
jgi:serine/threonine protein kinase